MRTHYISNQMQNLPQYRPNSAKIYAQRAAQQNPLQHSQEYQPNYNINEQEVQQYKVYQHNANINQNRSGSANRQSIPRKPIMNNFGLNNHSFNNEAVYTEYNKHLPKQIFHDKEKLYYETLQLKGKIGEMASENLKLKQRQTALEQEAQKIERMIEEIEQDGHQRSHYSKSPNEQSCIIANIKKNLKDNKVDLEQKQDEINKLKKNFKFARIQELEAEKKAFSDETIRLKNLLDQSLNQRMNFSTLNGEIKEVETQFLSQNEIITQLRKENAELATAIKNLEDQNYHLQQSYHEIERRNQREIYGLKKTLKDKEKELRQQRKDIDKILNGPSQKSFTNNMSLKREYNSKVNQQNKILKDQINEKQQSITDLEFRINETQTLYRELLEKEKDENNVLKQELEKELKLNQNLRDRLRASDKMNKTESYRFADNPVDFVPNKKHQERTLPPNIIQIEDQEKGQDKKQSKKRVEVVTLDLIKETGEELNYKFRSKGYEWDEIVQIVFPNIDDESDIPTLKKILQEEPFNIKDDKTAELISRYCIENNTYGNWMLLDLSKSCSNQIIKSILRQIVGPYHLLTQQEAQQTYQQVLEIILTKKRPLQGFMKEKAKNRNFIKKQDLIDVFNVCEIELQKDYLDYILTTIILDSEELNKLNFEKIFHVFDEGKETPPFCIYNQESMNALSIIKGHAKGEESDDDFKDLTEAEREQMRREDEMQSSKLLTESQNKNRTQSNASVTNKGGIRKRTLSKSKNQNVNNPENNKKSQGIEQLSQQLQSNSELKNESINSKLKESQNSQPNSSQFKQNDLKDSKLDSKEKQENNNIQNKN